VEEGRRSTCFVLLSSQGSFSRPQGEEGLLASVPSPPKFRVILPSLRRSVLDDRRSFVPLTRSISREAGLNHRVAVKCHSILEVPLRPRGFFSVYHVTLFYGLTKVSSSVYRGIKRAIKRLQRLPLCSVTLALDITVKFTD
jgi:hypothetical protein